jgi:predicted phage terminase large subunit-like protein
MDRLRSDIAKDVSRAAAKLLEKQEARAMEGRLMDFVRYVWPVVEPSIPMVEGWAIDAIAHHLEAVTAGEIRRLLINVPPGFMKSLLTNVFWPAWEWGPKNRPWYRYVCASYSNHLTERDNLRCRNVVMSERYQRLWRGRFRISNEQFTKVKFANDQTGWKLATSVGGIGVGERGDRFVIDDPNNTMMMESEAVRWTTNMWFTEVVPDRLNNPKESAIVVIQQRLHEEDVSGVALENDLGYTHLCVPMEYVPNGMVCGYDINGKVKNFDTWDNEIAQPEKLFWIDPRSEDGELAWPERFGKPECEEIKHAKKEYAWSGQYQQSPEIRGGSIIRREYWQTWDAPKFPENIEYILASLDTAYTEKQENDASALTIWGMFREQIHIDPRYSDAHIKLVANPKFVLLHAWNVRLEMHALVTKVIQSCMGDVSTGRPPVDRLLIESKATGISVSQEIRRLIGFNGTFGIELINSNKMQGDKVARAHSIIHMFADGMIYTPKGMEWCDQVINQCAIFPKGSHDDLVDSVTMALRYLRDHGFGLTRDEARFEIEEEYRYKRRLPALYPC